MFSISSNLYAFNTELIKLLTQKRQKLYGAEVSPTLISNVTDAVIVVSFQFIISRCDGTKMFKSSKNICNQMPVFI